MGNYTIFYMFENPRRGRQARNFTTNVSKILDLKSSSEQIFYRKLSLGAPVRRRHSKSPIVLSFQRTSGTSAVRSRTGQERRRQTLCDMRDNNFVSATNFTFL